jgi:hypothetical protein
MLVGTFSMGAMIPTLLEAVVAIEGDVAKLQAKLEGLKALAAKITVTPPTIDADIIANLQAAITIGLPSVDIQASAVAAAIATLEVELGTLNAFLAIGGVLGVAGIHVYAVTGTAQQVAAELNADLSPGYPGAHDVPEAVGQGFLLIANAGAAAQALTTVIKVG